MNTSAKNLLNRNSTILLFCVFILITYIKCVLFEHVVYSEINTQFLSNHLPKIIISIFIGSPILILKKKNAWYATILSLIIDCWFVANFVYSRYNGSPIDAMVLSMAGNMDGFWNSVFLFLEFKIDILPFLLTCSLIPFLFLKCQQKEITTFICMLLSLYPLSFLSHYMTVREKQYWVPETKLEPTNLGKVFHIATNVSNPNENVSHISYKSDAETNSGIHLLINDLILLTALQKNNNVKKLTESEVNLLHQEGYYSDLSDYKKFDSKLIIILVESMESWILTEEAMPNLWNYMQNHNHIFASKMISQTRFGGSADGQMILNTGLLPLYYGAACYRFPNNTYPAIAKLAKGKSLCMLPHKLDVWNQVGMSLAYGYTDNVTLDFDDDVLFRELNKYIEKDEYQVIQLLTMSTHAYFDAVSSKSKLNTDPNMPIYEQNYLKSFHYVDEQMGKFLSKIETSEAFKDLTIVITGDHTIFPKDKRDELMEYSKSHNNIYYPEEYTCALILSNKLDKQIRIDHVCYQMDIYPTLTSLLECGYKNYRGIGKNLKERNLTPQEIEYNNEIEYSNLIISSNFFGLNND